VPTWRLTGSPDVGPFTSSTTFRILWWNPCLASKTGCGRNWPPGHTRRRAGLRGHRLAKTITNCVANRWGDGPDTPAGVRDRAARANDQAIRDLLARVDDTTIAAAIRVVKEPDRRWMALPPGGKLTLAWPLPPAFTRETTEHDPARQ
jgi:hypothetical protein